MYIYRKDVILLSTEWELTRKGKVRDIYTDDSGEYIALVASDRVSAFDSILPVGIEDKGKILTRMSAFWFGKIFRQMPSLNRAFITIDNNEMDPFFQEPKFEGRTTLMKRVDMLPVEAIVRGYITGSLWKSYKEGNREFCGLTLPEGLENCAEMGPIFTPTTKAPQGQHDENISFEEMIELFREEGYPNPESLALKVRDYSLDLYAFAKDYAGNRGVILADTKVEFGLDEMGELYIADELFTPDSSRFWPRDAYQPGREQPSLDKQIIRDYIASHKGTTEVPEEILEKTKAKYQECLDILSK